MHTYPYGHTYATYPNEHLQETDPTNSQNRRSHHMLCLVIDRSAGWVGGGAEAMAPPKVSSEPIFIKESQ